MHSTNKLAQIGLAVLTACLFMGQANKALAQTNIADQATNVIRHVTREELREMSTKRILEREAQRTNVVRHLSKEDEEWVKIVQLTYVPPQPWPEAFHKKETLQHCAAVLRSAIDTNEIELACGKLTNQPEAAVALKNFSQLAMLGLDEFATILTIPEITTRGYYAELSDSKNYYFFTFWQTNNHPSMVRGFEKRFSSGGRMIIWGDFYENGRLRVFSVPSLDSNGILQESSFLFKEDGKLDRQWIRPVQETNVIRRITKEDFEALAKQMDDASTKETNVIRHLTKEDQEWLANVQRSHLWPEAAHPKETLQHCAAILRSAIDTNNIELACGKLINQPEAAAALKNLSKVGLSALDEFAGVLAHPKLTIRRGESGYIADLSDSGNYYFFHFWTTTNNLPTMVKGFRKHRLDGSRGSMGGDFFANGKLRVFSITPPDSKSDFEDGANSLFFTEDGKLDHYSIGLKKVKP